MRGSGGNVNRGVGVYVDDRKEGGNGTRKVVGTPPGKGDVRLVAIGIVFDQA